MVELPSCWRPEVEDYADWRASAPSFECRTSQVDRERRAPSGPMGDRGGIAGSAAGAAPPYWDRAFLSGLYHSDQATVTLRSQSAVKMSHDIVP
jgi:hypothetical protein